MKRFWFQDGSSSHACWLACGCPVSGCAVDVSCGSVPGVARPELEATRGATREPCRFELPGSEPARPAQPASSAAGPATAAAGPTKCGTSTAATVRSSRPKPVGSPCENCKATAAGSWCRTSSMGSAGHGVAERTSCLAHLALLRLVRLLHKLPQGARLRSVPVPVFLRASSSFCCKRTARASSGELSGLEWHQLPGQRCGAGSSPFRAFLLPPLSAFAAFRRLHLPTLSAPALMRRVPSESGSSRLRA